MTLTDLLKEWTAIHEEHVGKTMPLQPISEEDLAAAEAGHGFTFPDELREMLRYTNGLDHRWTGGNWMYSYFPEAPLEPISENQNANLTGVKLVLEDSRDLESRHGIQPGEPDDTAAAYSVQLMADAAGDVYGIVADGWAKGWLWRTVQGDYPFWYASSLTVLVSDCIEFEKRGLLDWESNGENRGCDVAPDAPRIGFGHFSENGPGPATPEIP